MTAAAHIHDGCGQHQLHRHAESTPRDLQRARQARTPLGVRSAAAEAWGEPNLDPYGCTKLKKGVRGPAYVLAASTFRADGGTGTVARGRQQDRGLPVPHRLRHRRLRRPHRQGRAHNHLHGDSVVEGLVFEFLVFCMELTIVTRDLGGGEVVRALMSLISGGGCT